MKQVNSKNFISMLSEEKPAMCFFHYSEEENQVKKIKDTINKIKNKFPLLPVYEYIIDSDIDSQNLCEVLEIIKTPILIFYKNGCFNRYKDKQFTEDSIIKFLGNKKQYEVQEIKKSNNNVNF